MAINLASASDGRVDFGDLAGLAGQTALSFAFVLKPTAALVDGRRLFSQWGSGGGDQVVICQVTDTTEIGVAVSNGAATYGGRKTTSVSLTNGSTYRIVVTIAFGATMTWHIYVNGVDQTLATFVASNDIAVSIDGAGAVQIGHETNETADGLDADFAEFAIWQRVLTLAQANAFTVSNNYPSCCGPAGLLYLPMNDASDLTDRWGSVTGSLTGGSTATHPAMVACGGGRFGVINKIRPAMFRPGLAR